MENHMNSRSTCCGDRHRKKNSGSFWGTILIIIGLFWILKEYGWHIGLPGWDAFRHAMIGFVNIFHVNAWSVSLPVILLIIGVLLLIGRRLIGTLLIIFAILFLLPHLIVPGILAILFFPVLLIVLGIIVLTRLL